MMEHDYHEWQPGRCKSSCAHPDHKEHDPLRIARDHFLMGVEGTHCEHGVGYFDSYAIQAHAGPQFMCGCCGRVLNGGMSGMNRCHSCVEEEAG